MAFIRSRHGRAVIAIREDEIAAEPPASTPPIINFLPLWWRRFSRALRAAFMRIYIGVLDPSKFDFNYSVEILIMVVLGGMGSITGSVCSATVLTLLPEMLRSFADKRMLIYSLVLIIVMLFKPTGLLGTREFPCEKLWVSYSKKKRRIPARPGGRRAGKEA